jgi:hypothetical protein
MYQIKLIDNDIIEVSAEDYEVFKSTVDEYTDKGFEVISTESSFIWKFHSAKLQIKQENIHTKNIILDLENKSLKEKIVKLETQNYTLETKNKELETKDHELEINNKKLKIKNVLVRKTKEFEIKKITAKYNQCDSLYKICLSGNKNLYNQIQSLKICNGDLLAEIDEKNEKTKELLDKIETLDALTNKASL